MAATADDVADTKPVELGDPQRLQEASVTLGEDQLAAEERIDEEWQKFFDVCNSRHSLGGHKAQKEGRWKPAVESVVEVHSFPCNWRK